MRPNTSVRQPVLSGARRRPLSDWLRSWRRQPRKRSPGLFWSLLAVAFVLDGALAFLGVQLLGLAHWEDTPAAERRVCVPHTANSALWEPMRCWAIRIDGKPRLFESVCREAVRHVTGEECFENNDPLPLVVSWILNGSVWEEYPFLCCADTELRALLHRESRGLSLRGAYVEPAILRRSKTFRKILRGVAAKGGAVEGIPLSSLEREAVELNRRLARFDLLRSGGVEGGEGEEMHTATAALREAYHGGSADVFAAALTDFLDTSRRSLRLEEDLATAHHLRLENWLNEYRPFRQAMMWDIGAIGLLALSSLVGTRRPLWRRGCFLSGLLACVVCLGWTTAGMVCQAMLHEGTTVYEGVGGLLCGSFLALLLSVLLTVRFREGCLALAGALVSGCGLVLANHWSGALTTSWLALPKEEGNAWLDLQVFLLLGGYAALALAWSMAALTLMRVLLIPPSAERLRSMASLCDRSLGLAVILLAASSVIDGSRAMQSSGDWHACGVQVLGTLLLLPCCAVLLYGRLAGWIQPFGLVAIAVLIFPLIPLGWQLTFVAREGCLANFGTLTPILALGLINWSLIAHATLRYYFGRPGA